MRDIKFRAWVKDGTGNKMVDLKSITPLALSPNIGIDGLFIPFRKNTILMQYTGLKDKNGTEIYEGDIIEFVWGEDSCWGDEGTYRGYVQHDDGGYEVVYINRQEHTLTKDGYRHPNSKSDELQSFIRWTEGVNIEVIGNIYEKPELLESEE